MRQPFDVTTVHIHTARAGPAHQMGISLRRAAYETVRSYDLKLWTW